MRVKFEIDSDNKVVNVDDDYDNTEIKISNLDNGNKLCIININRELVLDGEDNE
jgi:hypothetical protein